MRATAGKARNRRRAMAVSLAVGVAYATFVAGGPRAGPAPTPNLRDPALVAQGEQLYGEHCASCHGAELE